MMSGDLGDLESLRCKAMDVLRHSCLGIEIDFG